MGTLLNESKVAVPINIGGHQMMILHLESISLSSRQRIRLDIKKLPLSSRVYNEQKYYMILNALIVNATMFTQGVTFR